MNVQKGFTLVELLIVVVIIAVLVMVFLAGLRRQIERGYDSRRKSDLARLKIVFDEYYNDNNCYPPVGMLDSCGGTGLAPYLAKIPCDPLSRQPYLYVPLNADPCTGYRILTKLADPGDTDIARLGCEGAGGCGFGAGYNYGVAAGTSVAQ